MTFSVKEKVIAGFLLVMLQPKANKLHKGALASLTVIVHD